jgi:RNA polymerase-binding transcription factor DksA
VSDAADHATDLSEREREDLVQARVNAAKAAPREADLVECLDCGGEIDPRRRAALIRVSRCTECATRFELEIRRGRPA